jgi:hypothetical protein
MLARRLAGRRTPMINRKEKGVTKPIPAPVGGWNARDGVDEMEDNEALILTNLFPAQGEVELRKGFTSHATGMGAAVETVGEFNAGSTRKMFAGADGKIWDSTAAGAASSLATGFSSNRWQWAQFDDASGGARVGLVNGADAPQIHTGAAVSAMTISGSGLTPSNLSGINIFKNRSYFWDYRTQDFWYSATNALGGALTKFPLGRVSGTGGNMIAMGTWSRDGGDGADDLAAFLLSSGDVLVYAGDDPGSGSAWSLVGRFTIGAPMGVRALTKVGADLIVATRDGYVSLAKTLASGRAQQSEAFSDKIRKAVLLATKNFAANFGWQVLHYPGSNMGIFNIPISGSQFEQHVINTLTGSWCKFSGINARAFGMYNDSLYFGGAGGVIYKADNGRSDGGAAISATGQTSWSYLGSRQRHKRFTLMRPILETDGALEFSAGIGVDFGIIRQERAESSSVVTASPWDSPPWDSSPWSDETAVSTDWLSAEGDGYNVSSRIDVVTSTRLLKWLATHYRYEPGRGSM